MDIQQSEYLFVDKVLYIPSFYGGYDNEESSVGGGERLYSLRIVKSASLHLLFGLFWEDVDAICFDEQQIMKLIESDPVWFSWGMKAHLFLKNEDEVFSARMGEDEAFRVETHDFRFSCEKWSKGNHLYIPDYLIG